MFSIILKETGPWLTKEYLESCGLQVPALKSVGDACVNHFSESRL